MLMRTDPFREMDRLVQALAQPGTWTRPAPMPMDAYRAGDEFVVTFDLPGVDPASIDLNVERNTLTVRAERPAVGAGEGEREVVVAERPHGVFSRQLFLGESLDTGAITASYAAGVLTLHIPVTERAKPRRIEIGTGEQGAAPIETRTG
jgi:HSP20 family protein